MVPATIPWLLWYSAIDTERNEDFRDLLDGDVGDPATGGGYSSSRRE
jgi:hypothetical protein